MLIDAAREPIQGSLSTEIVIIGGGAAGLTLALALDRLGVQAILLEAGGEKFSKSSQEFYRASRIEPAAHGPVHLYRRRAFGGTTAIWGGRCIPFDPIDFEERPWIPYSSWPIAFDEVAPFYEPALEICHAGPAHFIATAALPVARAGPLFDGCSSADVVLDRVERFSEPTHLGRAYGKRLAASRHITVVLGAAVGGVETNGTGTRALGVRGHTARGEAFRVAARRTVIAAGGLETVRLLLASNDAKSCGLGNERDLVGRFYQAHLEGEVGSIRFGNPSEARIDYERSAEGVYCRRYIWLDPAAQRRDKLANIILRPTHANIVDPGHGDPVLSAMFLVKDLIVSEYSRKLTSTEIAVREAKDVSSASFYGSHIMNVVRRPLAITGFALDWTRRRVLARRKLPSVVLRSRNGVYPLDLNAEQVPNPDSRVALGDEKDPHGLPRLTIDWRTTDLDRRLIAASLRTIRNAVNASTAATIEFGDGIEQAVGRLTRIGGHHIGTARMAATAATGVTDRHGELFETRGLYVAGSALFPTSGFANPTLTIMALALRLADHLATSRSK